MSRPSRPSAPEHDAEDLGDGEPRSTDASCSACGAELDASGSFCPDCGAWLSDRIAPSGG